MQNTQALLALASVVGISFLSLAGIAIFAVNKTLVQRWLLAFVSFSTGALLGDVFIHILPEMAEDAEAFPSQLMVVLAGIVCSFVVEKIIHWRHCHILPSEHDGHNHTHHHCHPMGTMSLIGDAAHNLIDGVVIAAGFLVSVQVGLSTSLAVLFHEIPHEIGNIAVLLHSGFTLRRAVLMNLLSALTGLLGATVIIAWSAMGTPMNLYFLPFAAGNLLYIAGSDLIPELHKETRTRKAVIQLLAMLLGIGVMYALTLLE